MPAAFPALVAALLLMPAPAGAQSSPVDELIQLARAAPPEISADTLIKLATGRRELPVKARVALLDEAWALADNAQEPLKRHLVPGVDPGSRDGWLSRAFLLDLDRLSLRSRVLIGLVRDEPVRARDTFKTIHADIPSLTCRDNLAYDVETYYRTAAMIAQQAFTRAERARGDHVAFLENVIYGIRSPSQVPAIARMLIELESREELERLTGVFTVMLRGVQGDDRAFSHTMLEPRSRTAIEQLALECKARGVQADGLVDAYRSYLVHHMTQRRCASPDGGRLPGEDIVERFNTTLRRAGFASASELPPIAKTESKPIAVERVAKPPDSTLRSRSGEITVALVRAFNSRQIEIWSGTRRQVVRAGSVVLLADANRRMSVRPLTPDFHFQVHALKDRLALWRPGPQDDPEEYFQLKSGLYESLFLVDPTGPFSDEVLADCIDLLAHHDIDRGSRAGWYLRVHDLLQLAAGYGPTTLGSVRQRVTFSGHPALKAIVGLTAALERARPG